MTRGLYGVMAEFEAPEALVEAARRVRADGYRRIDGYSPVPVEGLAEALEFHRTWVPQLVFAGGLVGAVSGYLLQYWVSVVAYPLNVGGRPLNTWPMFVPVTFETTILVAALAAVLGMLALNGLPMPYHPVFNVPEFARASQDRFFLCVEAADPRFDVIDTRRFLQRLGAVEVFDVPA